MINKKNRLNKDKEIDAVFKNRKSCYNKYTGVLIKDNKLNICRFVIIISNKTVKEAVKRNLIKRRIKSILDNHQNKLVLKVDVVVLAKREIVSASFDEIETDILYCFKKLQVIQ